MSARETPETQAAFEPFYKAPWRVGLKGLVKLLMHSRRLETERDELREALEPFVYTASSEVFTTLVVRSSQIKRARTLLMKVGKEGA